MSRRTDGSETNEPQQVPGHGRRRFLVEAMAGVGLAGGLSAGPGAVCAEPIPGKAAVNPRLYSFVGGKSGAWEVVSIKGIVGDPLPQVDRLDIVNRAVEKLPEGARWALRGVTSNERYVTRAEKEQLVKKQEALGRSRATHAALIPIRKNAKWWALSQDERRAIFEEQSKHIRIGLKYLPKVARRLHHCRDLAVTEPFDFLTLFDYARADAAAFDELVSALRATAEWKFVDREVDIRLVRVKG
jgi:hypothetical protein